MKIKEETLIDLLYKLISKYDGHHYSEVVKKSIPKSEEYKELIKFLEVEV